MLQVGPVFMNTKTDINDDMRREYDFSNMQGGVREKYAETFDKTMVVLDSDVAKLFPNSKAVNEALRTIARVLRDK